LILNNLVDVLNPTVSDAEVTKEVENIKKNYENEEVLKRLDEMYKPETENFGALKRKMMMKKVID
jgi:FKBP-type peptidyl-prolyl cis-trans isomerase (trigger factor)